MARHYEWDDYFRPGSTVLANKFGIGSAGELRRMEYAAAAMREQQIESGHLPVARTFDQDHLAAVHRALFGDTYEWAGELRTVDVAKDGVNFARVGGEIEMRLQQGAEVAWTTDWGRVDRETFARRMAAFHAEVNLAHPFREGNGRATKVMLNQLAERTPFRLEWDRVSPQEWNQASGRSRRVPAGWPPVASEMAPVFRGMTVDRQPQRPPGRTPATRSMTPSPEALAKHRDRQQQGQQSPGFSAHRPRAGSVVPAAAAASRLRAAAVSLAVGAVRSCARTAVGDVERCCSQLGVAPVVVSAAAVVAELDRARPRQRQATSTTSVAEVRWAAARRY